MELYNNDFDYSRLDEKVKSSLQKYFNGMCYRPTSFGMFSAFTSLNWSAFEKIAQCVLGDSGTMHLHPDFQFAAEVARKMERSGEFGNVKYLPNNAIYGMKGEKRYLTERFDHKKKKTEFIINSFETNRPLSRLLSYCRGGKTKAELIACLSEFVDDQEDVKAYVNELITEGLLITELYPNMTEKKYFERLVAIADEHKQNSELAKEILLYENLLERTRSEKRVTPFHRPIKKTKFALSPTIAFEKIHHRLF